MGESFDYGGERAAAARKAAALAKLRAAAPGAAADRIEAAQGEPDPTRVHREILRQRFPTLPFLWRPWGRPGLPRLSDLAALATLAAYFSPAAIRRRHQMEAHFRAYFRASPAEQRRIEVATLGHPLRRRSIWRRLAFWR